MNTVTNQIDRLQTLVLLDPPGITVIGYFYAVNLGTGIHRVGKDARCSCYLDKRCPAVSAVRAYLEAGRKPAALQILPKSVHDSLMFGSWFYELCLKPGLTCSPQA